MKLRDYQNEAVNAARLGFLTHNHVLIISPTASGKSVMIASVCDHATKKGSRVLVLCYQGEILSQNESALNRVNPSITTGIFCAGQGRKDTKEQVIFASRQSLARHPKACGDFDIVIVDEAHMINPEPGTEYMKIFEEIKAKYVLGFTGTPWRLTGGKIWETDKDLKKRQKKESLNVSAEDFVNERKQKLKAPPFFKKVAYNIELDFLIEQGFLSDYRFGKNEALIDTSELKVSRATKDFDERELEALSSTPAIVNKSIDSWEAQASDRRVSIFFCCSVAHSKLTTDLLEARGHRVGRIDGMTSSKERAQLLLDAKLGKYKCLVNVGVLTTGVDIPIIDCVVMLRATRSASLFVQSCGRGLRVFEGKKDCLILDFTDNMDRFDNLNTPLVKKEKLMEMYSGDGTGKVPEHMTKICPECIASVHIARKVCEFCQHIFINHKTQVQKLGEKSHKKTSGWFDVTSFSIDESKTKSGEECYVVTYRLKGRKNFKEWLLHTRDGEWGIQNRIKKDMLIGKMSHDLDKIYVDDKKEDFPRAKRLKFKEGIL